MKSALVFLALVAVSQAGVSMPRRFHGKIVNGEEAEWGEIPYQVSLQTRSNFHFCGGSVLNKNYVITAAHCVAGKTATSIKVIAGSIDLNDPRAVHSVVRIISHDDYNPGDSWINDIALLKVGEPFEFSKTLSHVFLPERNAKVPADSVATVSGWGRLWQGGASPMKLQRTDLVITDPGYCSKVYENLGYDIHHSHICANDPTVETGSCHGDSGGPLTVDGNLVGLVSWAQGCASKKYPTVYTKVSEFIEWINIHAV